MASSVKMVMAMSETQTTIDDLVRLARAGNREAFAALVRAEQPRLVGTARAILRDLQEAEDVAQDALVKAWFRLETLRDPGRFRPWLYRILTRLARDRVRRPRLRLVGDAAPETPARPAADHTRLDALAREVERLPDRQRSPLVLHYLSGLTYAEIADVLSIPEKRVKSRLYDARRRLARRLEDERTE